jgi:exopolyphosphatase/pppGpp-phosphohydrolase
VDVIVGGAVILVTILRTLGFDEVLTSESDILDGLVRDLADR